MQGPEHAYAAWAEQYAVHHGVFKVFIGATPQVVVVDPNLSRKALKGSARRPEFPLVHTTQLERDMAGHHMLLQNGEPWRESRNAWTPFFTAAKMKAYFPTMLCCADELAEAVGARADVGDVFDVWPVRHAALCTMPSRSRSAGAKTCHILSHTPPAAGNTVAMALGGWNLLNAV